MIIGSVGYTAENKLPSIGELNVTVRVSLQMNLVTILLEQVTNVSLEVLLLSVGPGHVISGLLVLNVF